MSDTAGGIRRTTRVLNLLLVLVGAALVAASLGGLRWYRAEGGDQLNNVGGQGFTADDLHANATSLHAAVASAYFDRLAVILLVAGVVCALAATLPTRFCDPLRVLAFVVGLCGVIGTYYALAQLFHAQKVAGGSAHTVLHNASYGVWAALAGFALITLAGALGPRRTSTVGQPSRTL